MGMADVEKVKQGCECCDHPYGERKCRECPYKQFPKPYCNIQLGHDALCVIESQQAEIERLKAHKPDCDHAEHDSGGCLGYGRSE